MYSLICIQQLFVELLLWNCVATAGTTASQNSALSTRKEESVVELFSTKENKEIKAKRWM